jgi:hypothetical protein
MSRSVKQEYPPKAYIPTLKKYGAVIHISDEQLYSLLGINDVRYLRQANKVITLPTSEDWALYHQAVQGLRAMEAYEGTEWGGPDTGTEVHKPEPRVTYEWLETHDEWIARCHALRQAEKGKS